MKYLVQINHKMRYLFKTKIIFLLLLFLGISQISAQEVQTTSGSVQESNIYDKMQTESDSLSLNDLTDLVNQVPAEEWETFDPSAIYNSVDIQEADWAFEIPLSVNDIPSIVKYISVATVVNGSLHSGRTYQLGRTVTKIKLVNGAFNGKILVGINYDRERLEKKFKGHDLPTEQNASSYGVYLTLVDPNDDDNLIIPTIEFNIPTWRMASPDEPFNWITGARFNIENNQ